jgi:hypothetical protein
LPPEEYYRALASSRACLSPTGFRADCYRHLECIALGCVPVVNRMHETQDAQSVLRHIYGSSIAFLDNDEMLPSVGRVLNVSPPDRSLVFVATWLKVALQRLHSLGHDSRETDFRWNIVRRHENGM